MEEQNALYMKDVFTSMVDAHWYYVLIAFFASFFGKNSSEITVKYAYGYGSRKRPFLETF